MIDGLQIDGRFCGPPEMANGGYACGRAAAGLGRTATVRLARPVPLDRPLQREREEDGAITLRDGDTALATARAATLDLEVPAPPTAAEANAATARFAGATEHPFPTCFVCGPKRERPDGLCLFPGPVEGRALVACTWRPHASLAAPDGAVAPEHVWAVLDCPGAFAAWLDGRRVLVLGQLTARIDERPRPDDTCVVIGWPISREGRKHFVGTALISDAGEVLARGRAIWIAIEK